MDVVGDLIQSKARTIRSNNGNSSDCFLYDCMTEFLLAAMSGARLVLGLEDGDGDAISASRADSLAATVDLVC